MTSSSNARKHGSDRGDYGFARIRDVAFDAVLGLWRKRRAAGIRQSDIAAILNRDPGWVSKQLSGPGNWTLRTFGELVEALNGEVEIEVHPIEDRNVDRRNYHAYVEYQSSLSRGTALLGTKVDSPGAPESPQTGALVAPSSPINEAV